MPKRRTTQEIAKVLEIRDALARDPHTDKTALAKSLECNKCTVFRVVKEIEANVPAPTRRCAECGARLFTAACLACKVNKHSRVRQK
jgi:hypothetical protein